MRADSTFARLSPSRALADARDCRIASTLAAVACAVLFRLPKSLGVEAHARRSLVDRYFSTSAVRFPQDGDVWLLGDELRLGLSHLGLGLQNCHIEIRWVELDEHIPGVHALVLLNRDAPDGGGHARADADD